MKKIIVAVAGTEDGSQALRPHELMAAVRDGLNPSKVPQCVL